MTSPGEDAERRSDALDDGEESADGGRPLASEYGELAMWDGGARYVGGDGGMEDAKNRWQ